MAKLQEQDVTTAAFFARPNKSWNQKLKQVRSRTGTKTKDKNVEKKKIISTKGWFVHFPFKKYFFTPKS